MRKLIHNLRQQPEEKRRHILHVLTVCFAFILLSLWVYSLGTTITSADNQVKASQDMKPLSAIKDNLVGGYQSFSDKN